ncbi:MAG: response regulator [Gemmatimonadetes bacterium]|jgi:DNA-binding response OmpR family regulator|nr:response regulator [Gemmatimonadota bacterium]MBT4609932.1 response regulator [Gemmatimonadota bacterium]MBT5060264.1 response regulator [Gemmatimonadota bacterium]MBT5141216.1 response regulator [Gemmatimonadota bacterium]MBT5588863.1 response regulator [Gemmatimonadota bacterium]
MNGNDVNLDLTGCKILVTDDVPANLDVLFQALDGEGYNIHVASDGATCLEVAAHSRPDLILLDVMMPGIDGYETCRRLKANGDLSRIPVIFLTARDDIEGIVEGFQAGGLDYVTKPFKKEEILLRIRTHLERTLLARRLADLNAHLEQKVAERTQQLQSRVAELEGKDRIAEHMLTIHSLEETLSLVLEVVSDVLSVSRAAIYLPQDDQLQPAAAIDSEAAGGALIGEALSGWTIPNDRMASFQQVRESGALVESEVESDSFVLVPILRNQDILGVLEVDGVPADDEKSALRALSSFALQAAIAIHDAQIRQDPSAWKDQLDEVLEIDAEIENPDDLDDLMSSPPSSR